MDVVLARESTEGFYADRTMFHGIGELVPTPEIALAVRKITAHASRRIARVTCEIAARRKGHVTAIGKAHVLKLTDGLGRERVQTSAGSPFSNAPPAPRRLSPNSTRY